MRGAGAVEALKAVGFFAEAEVALQALSDAGRERNRDRKSLVRLEEDGAVSPSRGQKVRQGAEGRFTICVI